MGRGLPEGSSCKLPIAPPGHACPSMTPCSFTQAQIFALKNGNRGRDGKEQRAGGAAGGLSYTVDHDKVPPELPAC